MVENNTTNIPPIKTNQTAINLEAKKKKKLGLYKAHIWRKMVNS